jgi:phosphonatase-like hydrolase
VNAIRLAVFDIAGTTVVDRDEVLSSLQAGARTAGLAADPAWLREHMGQDKRHLFRLLAEAQHGSADHPSVETAFTAYHETMLQTYREHCEPIPGVEAAFAELRASGVKVALDTGFDRPILEAVLAALAWGPDRIDLAVCTSDVRRGRPAPDMLFRAMTELEIDRVDQVVKVGDSIADLLEGSAAGCRGVVGVLSGTSTAAMLGAHPHTHIVESAAEVPSLLRREGWVA